MINATRRFFRALRIALVLGIAPVGALFVAPASAQMATLPEEASYPLTAEMVQNWINLISALPSAGQAASEDAFVGQYGFTSYLNFQEVSVAVSTAYSLSTIPAAQRSVVTGGNAQIEANIAVVEPMQADIAAALTALGNP